MEKTVERARGLVEISVSGGNPEQFLNLCARQGVELYECRPVSEVELRCTVPRRFTSAARFCAERAQCEMKIRGRHGASFTVSRVKRRYVLLSGLFFALLLLGVSGLYIWDIDVVGNENIKTAEILNVLEDCGVCIGANWTEFDADLIRAKAITRLPELSFITVNVNGSRATVIVRERIDVPEINFATENCDIIATKGGIITEISAYRGSPRIAVGSAVLAGDVLISSEVVGVGDAPSSNFVSSYGEVWAHTFYDFTASESLVTYKKVLTGRESEKFALIFGKTRLNLYSNTGIVKAECDTIYDVWKAEVGGLFTLPVSLVRESRAQYTQEKYVKSPVDVEARLKELLTERVERELGEGGQLQTVSFTTREDGDNMTVTLRATCLEQIGERRVVG